MQIRSSIPLRRLMMISTSVLLLIGVFHFADTRDLMRDLQHLPAWTIVAILGLLALNLSVVSYRLLVGLSQLGISLPARTVSQASVSGHLAGLFVISLFGQIVGRHLVLRQHGVPPILIASVTAYERIVLLAVSGGLAMIGADHLLGIVAITEFFSGTSLLQIALAAAGGLLVSFLLGDRARGVRLATADRSLRSVGNISKLVLITLLAQSLVLAPFVLGTFALYPDASRLDLFAAAAIISFAASMPVSVNGWGIREVTAVYTLGQLGVPASSALAISVLVGICATAVVLAASPIAFRDTGGPGKPDFRADPGAGTSALEIEKIAVWAFSIGAAILVLFQMHTALGNGVINLNLADPLAILALSAVAFHSFNARRLPNWRIPEFNKMLLVVSLLIGFAFLRGALEIGITQWALSGRVLGWVVLLGYLSIGYLTVAYLGSRGRRRFAETMAATVAVITVIQLALRWLELWGWPPGPGTPVNFEGFAGNRNAFSLQLVTCSILILAYSRHCARVDRAGSADTGSLKSRLLAFALLHSLILLGLVLTASRAGLVTEALILVLAWATRSADRRLMGLSLVLALAYWWLPQLIGQAFLQDSQLWSVQSAVSGTSSDAERWQTISRGVSMWLESPLLGAGLGVFIEQSAEWAGRPIVIHSTPVWIVAEFGLLGAGIFAWIIIRLGRHAARTGLSRPGNQIFVFLTLAFLVFGLVHEIFYQRIYWLVLGLALAIPGNADPPRKTP